MSQALEIMSNQIPASIVKSINKDLMHFTMLCREDSNMLGHDLWDDNFTKQIHTELQFYLLRR